MRSTLLAALLASAGCSTAPEAPKPVAAARAIGTAPATVQSLRFLGSKTVARAADGVTKDFGGISGADWDPATKTWYLLSDDRSDRAPARFYTAAIDLDAGGFKSIAITGVVPLKRPDGSDYPASKAGGEVADPEGLRFDARSGQLVWSSEGDRRLGLSPFVRRSTTAGLFTSEVALPDNLKVNKDVERGARNNLAIEGLSFTPSGELWVAMEAPLYEDGPVAGKSAGAVARFTRLAADGRTLAQYAYPLDAIQRTPTGGKLRGDNGVSDILAIDDTSFLVIERSGYEVDELVFRFAVRIYEVKLGAATDVQGVASLVGANYVPLSKRLVLDLNEAGIGEIDNIESAVWGPRLADGHATLVLLSDDNFAARQVNQFLAFEVLER